MIHVYISGFGIKKKDNKKWWKLLPNSDKLNKHKKRRLKLWI